MFQKFHVKQLIKWVFFGAIRHWHLGTLRKLQLAYTTLVRPQLEYAAPIWHPYHDTQIAQVEKEQRTAARWTYRRWRNTNSVRDMLDEYEWPSLEARREQSSLTFYKIHSGTVDLDKDKYLTPSPRLQTLEALGHIMNHNTPDTKCL